MFETLKNSFFLFLTVFVAAIGSVYAHPAWGIVVDSRKQIYFSDLETVWKIDTNGKLLIFKAGTSGTHVHDLTIDKQDVIYGWYNSYEPRGEKHLRSIWKITTRGEFTEIVPLTENLPTGMSVWQDSGKNMYAVEPWSNERRESKIIKRTPDGKTSLFAGGKYGYLDGKKEKARFGNVLDMAFSESGSIYLTDGNRVRKIDETGNVTTVYPNEKNQTNNSQLFGLDVDKDNNVFVADFANRKLLKIDFSGKTTTFHTSDKDWSPLGVAAFGDEVYVLEGKTVESKSSGNRVVKISADNRQTVIADLNNANKTVDQPKPENINFSLPNEENNSSNPEVDVKTKQTESRKLGFYGIAGAIFIAFAAFVFFRKNKIFG